MSAIAAFSKAQGSAVNAEVEGALREVLRDLQSAWSQAPLDEEGFAVFLGERLREEQELPAALSTMFCADLYLAFASLREEPWAQQVFEREFLRKLDSSWRRLSLEAGMREDILQTLRIKLFLGRGGSGPKLAEYSGKGPLLSWLRAVALRHALEARRDIQRQGAAEEVSDEMPQLVEAPELEVLKRQHREAVDSAFREALQSLTPDERTVLRLNALEQVNIEKIGALFGVSRATAGRMVLGAKRRLLEETRSRVQERLRLQPSEMDSVMALMRSGLQVSLSRWLS